MSGPVNGIFQGMDILASGLRAEMQRSEVVSANIANMESTGNAKKPPYRRRSVVFEEMLAEQTGLAGVDGGEGAARGVKVSRVVEDRTPFPTFHDPGHRDAGPDGYVMATNVDMFREMVDMQAIERSFGANLQAMRAYRSMLQSAITNITRT